MDQAADYQETADDRNMGALAALAGIEPTEITALDSEDSHGEGGNTADTIDHLSDDEQRLQEELFGHLR